MRALKVSYSYVGEGGVAVNCEKTQFFLDTLYTACLSYFQDQQLLLPITSRDLICKKSVLTDAKVSDLVTVALWACLYLTLAIYFNGKREIVGHICYIGDFYGAIFHFVLFYFSSYLKFWLN